MSLGLINHRITPFLAYKPDHVDDFTIAHGLISNADRDRFRDQTLKALNGELSLYSDHKWIISSEHFVARLVAKDELESLAALLDQFFDLEQIIIYVRKPIEAAISKWSTAVLAGWPSFTLAHPAASVEVCNHKGIIQKWIAVFGQHHFNVRLFHKGDFIGGDLIQDFLSACKIDCRRSLKTSHRTNLALSYQAIKLLSRVNEEIPATVGNRILIRSGKILENSLLATLRVFLDISLLRLNFPRTRVLIENPLIGFGTSSSRIKRICGHPLPIP